MMISFAGIFRWGFRIAAASCVVAIAVGRMCGPAPVLRSVAPAHYVNVPGHGGAANLTLLDVRTGGLIPVELPDGDALDQASCSSWQDESGIAQLVGRWRTRSGQGPDRVTTEFGLGRYTFPGGECLDRVATDILPDGPPCWYPGTTAKVLFATADGGLYRFAFEGAKGAEATASGRDIRPQPIVWKVTPPGEDERSVRISDPVWPSERVFGGRIFVSLRFQVTDGRGLTRFSLPRVWWLKLDSKGEAIEAAGPMDVADANLRSGLRSRFPRPIRLADGSLRLAFLAREGGSSHWNVRVAEMALDSEGTPRTIPGTDVASATGCAYAPLANSPSGDWVYYVPDESQHGGILRAPTLARKE